MYHPHISLKTLMVLLFVVIQLELLLLAWRTEHNDSVNREQAVRAAQIARETDRHSNVDRQVFRAQCVALNEQRSTLNQMYQVLAELELQNHVQPKSLVDARVRAYRSGVVALLDCNRRPTN
jgi:hypothetical protein